MAGNWRSHGLSCPFFSQHPFVRGLVLCMGRFVSPSGGGASLLLPVTLHDAVTHHCDVIMQHATAEETHWTFSKVPPGHSMSPPPPLDRYCDGIVSPAS